VFALCSGKGSPGVTVTALACLLSWRRRLILAECDPAGGDITAGYLREIPLAGYGLAQLTASLARQRLAEDLWGQLVDLAPGPGTAMTRLVLPGLTDPAQATGLATGWAQLARLFRDLESDGSGGFDVIADCGSLSTAHSPMPVLAAADVVLLVLRPTLRSIRSSAAALAALARANTGPVGLVIVGDGGYSAKEIALELRTPLAAVMPHDPGTANVLSNGGEYHRGPLLRAAARAEAPVRQLAAAGRAAAGAPSVAGQPVPAREVHRVR